MIIYLKPIFVCFFLVIWEIVGIPTKNTSDGDEKIFLQELLT